MKLFFIDNQKVQRFLYILLAALLLFSFYPLLSSDPITSYDDQLLLGGVDNLHSFTEYKEKILAGKILDVQPVRDLSYIIDFKLQSFFPLHSFHLTNLLLWIGICFFFKRILDLIDDKKEDHQWLIWSVVFLYALSPVFTSSVAWIAGRKHLLSTFFTVWATYLFLKMRSSPAPLKNSSGIIILYILAVFSQPINILWPLFVFIYSYFDKKISERKKLLISLAVIAVIGLAINLYYYGSLYEQITAGDGKYDSAYGPGLSLLALGRYFYLTLFPFDSLPVSHYQGSWENMVGMVLMIIFLFWVYKRRVGAAVVFCFIAYFFLPLIPVTYKITRIFCSDTYLLNASLGLYAALFLIFKNAKFKYSAALVFAYAGILFYINLGYINIFESTESIFSYAYAKEATPMSIVNVADSLVKQGKYANAKTLVSQLEVMEPDNRFYPKLMSDVIYKDPLVKNEEKIKGLELIKPKAPVVYLRLALLHSNQGNTAGFKDNVDKIFSDPQGYIRNSYLRNEQVVALIKVGCEKNKIEVECKNQYEAFSKVVKFNNWRPELYKNFYFESKNNPNELAYE
ncbi:MAG: hypothetical protein H7177_02185 [Rhizobacter sp.]|nr:hypothetical protein [Bacteriovorax sp.]